MKTRFLINFRLADTGPLSFRSVLARAGWAMMALWLAYRYAGYYLAAKGVHAPVQAVVIDPRRSYVVIYGADDRYRTRLVAAGGAIAFLVGANAFLLVATTFAVASDELLVTAVIGTYLLLGAAGELATRVDGSRVWAKILRG